MTSPESLMNSMDTFLATLTTTVATLLGILLAAVTVYYAFLQERRAEYGDQRTMEILTIGEQLGDLAKGWFIADMLCSQQFIERYRSKRRNLSGADLVKRLSSGIIFSIYKLQDEFSEVDPYPAQPWRGRLYYLLLREITYVMAQKSDVEATGVFPSADAEIGFDEWRVQFMKLKDGALQDAAFIRDSATEDFREFSSKKSGEKKVFPQVDSIYSADVVRFFGTVDAIKARLREISKLEIARERYTFAKVHVKQLLALCLLSFVFGVLIPLALLLAPDKVTPSNAEALMAVAVVVTASSFVRFGRDVFLKAPPDRDSYLSSRWLRPMIKDMERQASKFSFGGPIDVDLFVGARNSNDSPYFTREIFSGLSNYVEAVEEYNSHLEGFSDLVLESFFNDKILGPTVSKGFSTKGGWGITPYDILSQSKIASLVARLCEHPERVLSISKFSPKFLTPGPTELTIPGAILAANQQALEAIRTTIKDNPITVAVVQSHQAVSDAGSILKKALESASELAQKSRRLFRRRKDTASSSS